MKTDLDYEKDCVIDHNALDIEWLRQSELSLKYGTHWADCTKKLQQAEENVKLVRSELIADAYNNPEETLGEGQKATGQSVEAYYRNHDDHILAKEEFVEAQYQLNIAEIAKKAITVDRKAALDNLVKLFGLQYFSGPAHPRELSKEVLAQNLQKTVNKTVGKKLTRRKKNG